MSRAFRTTALRLMLGLVGILSVACVDAGVDPRWVETIWFQVDSLQLEVGGTVSLDAVLIDQNRNPINSLLDKVHWGVSDSTLADVELEGGVGQLRALAPGGVTVTAELGRGIRQIPVWIRPSGLARVEVYPDPVVVSAFGSVRPELRLFGAAGQRLDPAGFRIRWRPELARLVALPDDSASLVRPPLSGRGVVGETSLIVTVNHIVHRVPLQITSEGSSLSPARE